jgi:hypothetical protein
MRQDFFEYRPSLNLAIAGNQKPSLRSVDEAMRRRRSLIDSGEGRAGGTSSWRGRRSALAQETFACVARQSLVRRRFS